MTVSYLSQRRRKSNPTPTEKFHSPLVEKAVTVLPKLAPFNPPPPGSGTPNAPPLAPMPVAPSEILPEFAAPSETVTAIGAF